MCKDCTTHTAPADDMDGGVTAALIEKEAEESPSVDYEAMWRDAERRAEKAEQERDEARATKNMHKARADKERARADAAEPRPLTADDIEQLVTQNRYRVADAIRALYPEEPMATDVLANAVMTALTEPTRPEDDADMRERGL